MFLLVLYLKLPTNNNIPITTRGVTDTSRGTRVGVGLTSNVLIVS